MTTPSNTSIQSTPDVSSTPNEANQTKTLPVATRKPPTMPKLSPDDDKHITRDEARTWLKAMDKVEFGGWMKDYMDEISDPNNIKETNQFLKESEDRKDLPSNVKLSKPNVGFCIRSNKYNIKRPSNRQKVFINICTFDGIDAPSSDDNRRWSLPHLLNKGRNDQDKNKKMCIVYDVIFHPKAVELSNSSQVFKKFVCDTAINGINSQILSAGEEKISSDFILKTKFNYKGVEVAYMNVHGWTKTAIDDRKEPNEFHKTELMKEVEKIKNETKENNNDEDTGKAYDQLDVDVDHVNADIEEQKEMDKNSKVPKYIIKYSNNFDINNYFYEPEGVSTSSGVSSGYKRMVVDIQTPKMANAADAELEIDVKEMKFKFKDVYEWNVKLPYEIEKESVGAKFDKTKKVLTITLNIVQKEVKQPEKIEDENIEIVKIGAEEEERKREEKLRMIKESEEKAKAEAEVKRKQEEEEKRKQEEEEEVFITAKKNEIVKKEELPLKDVKYKREEDNEETTETKGNRPLVEALPKTESKETDKSNTNNDGIKQETQAHDTMVEAPQTNKKDEDDLPSNPISINKITGMPNEDTTTPIVFLNFNSDWIFDVE